MMTQDTLEHFLVIREAQKLSSGLRFGPGISYLGMTVTKKYRKIHGYSMLFD